MNFLQNYFSQVPEGKRSSSAIAYMASLDAIYESFPDIAKSIVSELQDQRKYLKLIASENYSSLPVQLAMGNLLTDKYSEGFVRHRFYAGCENVDDIEEQAENLAKKLFQADHAYVQPHSGADANLVAFWAILTQRIQNKEIEKLGKKNFNELTEEEHEKIRQLMMNQKVMGMSLNSGGHLTHGYRLNISSKIFCSHPYEVDRKTGLIDYKALEEEVKKVKPLILIAGYSAYTRLIDFAKMREIADTVGAVLMVDMAHFAGLVAGKAMQGNYDPVPFAHVVTTTTHKTLRGPRGGLVLCKEEFKDSVNKGCPIVLGGPMPHVIAAKALAFKEACSDSFKTYASQIIKNAQALAEGLSQEGVEVLTGGTDNHMVLFDVEKSFRLTGRQAELALREGRMTVNRNAIPWDVNGAWYTSGIRVGTPALTTLGMKEKEMKEVAYLMSHLLKNAKPGVNAKTNAPSKAKVQIEEPALKQVHERVESLLSQYPLYPELAINQQLCNTK